MALRRAYSLYMICKHFEPFPSEHFLNDENNTIEQSNSYNYMGICTYYSELSPHIYFKTLHILRRIANVLLPGLHQFLPIYEVPTKLNIKGSSAHPSFSPFSLLLGVMIKHYGKAFLIQNHYVESLFLSFSLV